MVASPQTSFGVRLSRIHFSPTSEARWMAETKLGTKPTLLKVPSVVHLTRRAFTKSRCFKKAVRLSITKEYKLCRIDYQPLLRKWTRALSYPSWEGRRERRKWSLYVMTLTENGHVFSNDPRLSNCFDCSTYLAPTMPYFSAGYGLSF